MTWHLYVYGEDLTGRVPVKRWLPVHPVGGAEPFGFDTPGEAIDFAEASSYAEKANDGGDGELAVAPAGWDGTGAPKPGEGLVAEGVTP